MGIDHYLWTWDSIYLKKKTIQQENIEMNKYFARKNRADKVIGIIAYIYGISLLVLSILIFMKWFYLLYLGI